MRGGFKEAACRGRKAQKCWYLFLFQTLTAYLHVLGHDDGSLCSDYSLTTLNFVLTVVKWIQFTATAASIAYNLFLTT